MMFMTYNFIDIAKLSAGEEPPRVITERKQAAENASYVIAAKCTRRHTGGNNSISVRMAALKLGFEL